MKPNDVIWHQPAQDTFTAVLIDPDGQMFMMHVVSDEAGNKRCLFRYWSEEHAKYISAFEMRCLIETAAGNKTIRQWMDAK